MKRPKTYTAKPNEIRASWRVMDATGNVLGRLATQIARTLQGKDKPVYTPNTLTGDYVVVVNASRVRVTGRKETQKLYYKHSGYIGNLKTFTLRDLMEKHPDRVLRLAVKGMLPSNKLGRGMLKRLKIYPGETHPHASQVSQNTTER